MLSDVASVSQLLQESLLASSIHNVEEISNTIVNRIGLVGCKLLLRLVERAVGTCSHHQYHNNNNNNSNLNDASHVATGTQQRLALEQILDDYVSDQNVAIETCQIR
jgi:hypothetical protein